MLARLKNSKNGKNLPKDWAEGLARLMNETYSTECKLNGRYFDIFGQIYQDELLLVVSYLSEKDEYVAPITLFLSSSPDQIANVDKVSETQQNLIEVSGLFFDEIFANDDWNEFEPAWQEVTHKHQNYFYKISRENINATIEADRLLGPDFEDIEYDQDLDQ
jgi:hypothetical protein